MYVPHERRALILRLLEQRGYLRTAILAEELGVTEETIRTDFIALHERKLLHRVHGGARYAPPAGGAEDNTRLDCQLIELLLEHLHGASLLYIDAGALAHALLPHLSRIAANCRIITPSPRLALAAAVPALQLQVILPGGQLDPACQYIRSDEADAFFRAYRPDIALLLPPSMPAPTHIAYHHHTRAQWASAAAQAATRSIIAAPAHIFYSDAKFAAPCHPHLIITEDNLPSAFESVRAELVPYLSPADLRQEDDISI